MSDSILFRTRKTKNPCLGCGLHLNLCVCGLISRIEVETRLTLIIHHRELKRTTNTGQLALKSLVNSEMVIRGKPDTALDFNQILSDDYYPILLFPSDDATLLTNSYVHDLKKIHQKPIQLIVPDGNWRQASKIHYRYKEISHLPRVVVNKPKDSDIGIVGNLRAETTENGMATLQAIAEAFGVLENENVKKQLNDLFLAKLKNTLIGRGKV